MPRIFYFSVLEILFWRHSQTSRSQWVLWNWDWMSWCTEVTWATQSLGTLEISGIDCSLCLAIPGLLTGKVIKNTGVWVASWKCSFPWYSGSMLHFWLYYTKCHQIIKNCILHEKVENSYRGITLSLSFW